MEIFTNKKVSPRWKLSKRDVQKLTVNILKFTAPALAVFFGQLAIGVDAKASALMASFILYQLLADFFTKLGAGK